MGNVYCLVLAAVLMAVPGLVAATEAAEVDEARADQLEHVLVQECGSCHGLEMRGGLGPALTPDAIEGRHDDYLRTVILHGVPGTPMPGWDGMLSEAEAQWLVDLMREGLE